MPNVLAIRVNETGSITDFTDFWLRDYRLGGVEVKVTLEEAVNKALKVAKTDMQWIGVKGISQIENTSNSTRTRREIGANQVSTIQVGASRYPTTRHT